MEKHNSLDVLYGGRRVGTLALYRKWLAAFQYDADWLRDGFSISPFSLPAEGRVFIPKYEPFGGLFGVFSDSLPDGWGRLLVDRMLLKQGVDPAALTPLDRLAIVGDSGMGALTYRPSERLGADAVWKDLDHYAKECARVLSSSVSDDLDELFRLGGSSGGARPKIMTKVDGEDWIIKFPASADGPDAGAMEYAYSLCAKRCGIGMSETRLFPSRLCGGYFGTKRFDRVRTPEGVRRIHMVTASAMLETSHRLPALDYDMLMKLTLTLTRDYRETEQLFRRMCFNVFARNRDDHAKNFSWLYLPESGWRLSPAYDLTRSDSIGGEHATTVHGEGRSPGEEHLFAVAKAIGLKRSVCAPIVEEIRDTVRADLAAYL